MSRLIASDNALRALLLLSQSRGGLRISEVAEALRVSHTGATKALEILVADGLASRSAERRYALAESVRAQQAFGFALAFLPAQLALEALVRGNPAVEFAGSDERGTLIVLRRFADPVAVARLRDAVLRLRAVVPQLAVEFAAKADVRETLLHDLGPRRRALSMRVLTGRVDRAFPDRSRGHDPAERPLGRLNPAIQVPSSRRLHNLARQYRLRRILAFGSATRTDFRRDSDIDLLVEPAAGQRLGLSDRAHLIADAESLFDRDIDLVTAPVRRTSLAEHIARDGVVLYDAAR